MGLASEHACPWCLKAVYDDDTIQEKDGIVWHARCKDQHDTKERVRRTIDDHKRKNPVNDAQIGAKPAPLPTKIVNTIDAADDPRHKQHGTFAVRSELAQTIKSHMRSAYGGRLAADQKQALDEIAGKISRICCGDANDPEHWDDIAGYAKLVSDRLKGVTR